MDRCAECGEPTVYEEELGSAVCTACGTLSNPTQSVLASHLEHQDTSGYQYNTYVNAGAVHDTLKGRGGWALKGQEKEAREKRNMIAMQQFIRTLAGRLSGESSVSRAQAIFDQAMSRGRYRWGRTAKLLAGASIAIAFREANKSDSLRDIAYMLEEPLHAVTRSFTVALNLLQLKLSTADPSHHLTPLQAHLLTLIRNPSALPQQLVSALTPLESKLTVVMRTARSLCNLVSRIPALANLPTASTACAIFILALEGELGTSLPQAGALAQALGARMGASKTVVMQRYKTVYDAVEEWIRDVPWLEAHERKAGKGRSKVAKRVVVARGLKDVVQFQEEIWRKRLESQTRPVLEIDVDESEYGEEVEEDGDKHSSSGMSVTPSQRVMSRRDDSVPSQPSKKRPKTRHDYAVQQVSQFLLHPLTPAAPASAPRRAEKRQDGAALLEHFLTADDSALSHAFTQPPTRLQKLRTQKGEEGINDEELFGEGELEGMLRTEDEVAVVKQALGWDQVEEDATERGRGKRKRDDGQDTLTQDIGPNGKRTKRVDMDALARLLDPSTNLDELDFGHDGDLETALESFNTFGLSFDYEEKEDEDTHPAYTFSPSAEEEVEEWRPLSPGGGGCDEDRYEV